MTSDIGCFPGLAKDGVPRADRDHAAARGGALGDPRDTFRISPADVDVGKALIRDRKRMHLLRATGPRGSCWASEGPGLCMEAVCNRNGMRPHGELAEKDAQRRIEMEPADQ